jgi:hypothetical protein
MRYFHRSLESELRLLSLPQASKSDSMGDKRISEETLVATLIQNPDCVAGYFFGFLKSSLGN